MFKILTPILFLFYFGDAEYHTGTIKYVKLTDLNQPLEASSEPVRETYHGPYEVTFKNGSIQFEIDNRIYAEHIVYKEKNGPNTIYKTIHWKVKVIEDFKALVVWWGTGETTIFTHPISKQVKFKELTPIFQN